MQDKNTDTPQLSDEMLELIAQRFRLLSDPMRLRILHHLQNGEKSVGQLVEATGASQPNVSKHLSTLKTHGIVKRRQEGNMAFFSIGAPFIFELCNSVCSNMKTEWEQRQNLLGSLGGD
jgi:DNA-binding transcriptional ArsR family regulator